MEKSPIAYPVAHPDSVSSPHPSNSILLLSDGSYYLGKHFGAERESIGELVFNTSMTGYQEALTDPSYAGQILVFSYPLQGNYGTNAEDSESEKVHVRAVVAREVCEGNAFSHYSANSNYSDYLRSFDVPGISNLDTRAIVRKVREHGVMPAAISPIDMGVSPKSLSEKIILLSTKLKKFNYGSINFVSEVCTKKRITYSPKKTSKRVALIDCGVKMNIIRELNLRDVGVTAFPYDVPHSEIQEGNFDGLLVSNGPGDPALMGKTIANLEPLLQQLPTLGICLGHQLIAHALGGTTYKLKFGHRGSNHAVLNPETGRTYITTQNHGYSVKDVPSSIADALFINCNDGTNEGLRHKRLPIISSQFHPEGACGPKDANFLFDEFLKMMK
ncbi:MAG: glutamine-hydrolyzing carbamoyl-phosphate synthase small subunit [Candidatus Micrarchaeota archaeon]